MSSKVAFAKWRQKASHKAMVIVIRFEENAQANNYYRLSFRQTSPAGATVVLAPPFEIGAPISRLAPGCCIHPILYLKNVPPLLVLGPSFWFLAPPAAKSWRRACLSSTKKIISEVFNCWMFLQLLDSDDVQNFLPASCNPISTENDFLSSF